MSAFRTAVESGDPDRIVAELADDVVFHSPVAHAPYHGKAVVGMILRAVFRVFEGFRYEAEIGSEDEHVLVFRARVDDKDVEGIDLLRTGEDGKVTELTVMVRPLSAATALAARMKVEYERGMAELAGSGD